MNRPNDLLPSEDECFQRQLSAENAIRDILYLYMTCLNYQYLYDDIGTEDGDFDPFFYIDCSKEDICFSDIDLRLLHEGSAVKLTCDALQSIGQGGYPETSYPKLNRYIKRMKAFVGAGRLKHLPKFEHFFILFLDPTKDGWSDEIGYVARDLYEAYVRGYVQSLLDPPTSNP